VTVPDWLAAIILGLVEGATEFIPVSSTGHLIVVGDLLGFTGERAKSFEIFIQLGAILAVAWAYRARLVGALRGIRLGAARGNLALNLALGFIPAAVVGLLAHDTIRRFLFDPRVVAVGLVAGALAILAIERAAPRSNVFTLDELPPGKAFGVGLAQLLALVPGVSRSGATILGGYCLGLSRPAATEFSFLLAIPVMVAATGFDLVTSAPHLATTDVPIFALGFVVAFVSALVVVRAFVRWVGSHDFRPFAWYRLAVGALLIGWYALR
jgi:undecaprenyl-diphosphatase